MIVEYRGFEISVEKSRALDGNTYLYYSVFRQPDYREMESGVDGDESIKDLVEVLKADVEDMIANPAEWE